MPNPAKNLIGIVSIVGQLNSLAILLDPANGDGRWDALQDWLKKNPGKKKAIETAAEMEPESALTFLLDAVGIDLQILTPFDPQGQIRGKATIAISHLQELYKSRKGEMKPKRKRKAIKKVEEKIIDAKS